MPKRSLLDSLEVKSPCTENWDEMFGNDTVRFCSHCAKDVHNLSEMTHSDALKIITKSNGNICARFIKRPDGVLQTTDRPSYQIGRRARIAAGAIAATLSLTTLAYSQGKPVKKDTEKIEKPDKKPAIKTDPITVEFTILDPNGATVAGATVLLTNMATNQTLGSTSNEYGKAVFTLSEPGKFGVSFSAPGFGILQITDLEITKNHVQPIALEVVETFTGLVSICILPEYSLRDAISENDFEKTRDALKEGAEVNPKNVELPPLHQAIILGHMRIVKLLLDYGANPNLRAEDGKVPLDYAETDEMSDLLKEYGAKEF